jgi:putative transposase
MAKSANRERVERVRAGARSSASTNARPARSPAKQPRPAARSRKPKQQALPFRSHGGPRKGAGRKPKHGVAGVAHTERGPLASRHPAHVTLKLRSGLPRLRQKAEYTALRTAFARGKDRFGFRLCHFAVLNDHLHLVVEAADRTSLRRGIQGLAIRIARALNRLWRRKGKVFADRYHARPLPTPREVRNALVYVLDNARQHAAAGRMVRAPHAIDLYSSAPWFDGFRTPPTVRNLPPTRPLAAPRSWLLRTGWRRHGLLDLPDTG